MTNAINQNCGWEFKTAGGDKKYLFYMIHNGRKYGIQFENGGEIVNKPTNPDYRKKFEEAVLYMEKNNSAVEKFYIVGIANPDKSGWKEGQNLKVSFVFPGSRIINIVIPFSIKEFSAMELKGQIGLRIRCIMEYVGEGSMPPLPITK